MRKLCVAFAALSILATLAPAKAADVFLNSGFFRTDHYDDVMPLWLGDMTIFRIYNSSKYRGMFGIGWETTLETNLEVQDDGSVLVREYGGGAYNQFAPTNKDARPEAAIASELVGIAAQTGRFGSDDEKEAYETWLADNHADEWARLRDLGLIIPQQSHAGEIFSSARFGENQSIIRVPEGYQRVTQGGDRFEAFDLAGHLQRVWDVNRNFIALRYARNGLAEISDNLGNRYAFVLNKSGLVESISGPGGGVARFQYDHDYLVKCIDAAGNTYRYTYDSLHRMSGIGFPDGKWKRITYYSKIADKMTSDLVVKQISNPDGSVTVYKYTSPDSTHTSTEVTTKDAAGKTVDYLYRYQRRQGSWDLVAIVIDGKTSEAATYDAGGHMISYTKGTVVTNYRLDSYGRRIAAIGPTATTGWDYDELTGRVSSATITGDGAKSWHYTYDSHGNLAHAVDSAGNDVVLSYDEYGRRTSATLGKAIVHFGYDRLFEPTRIWADGAGEADVTYDRIGDIKKVAAPGGGRVDAKLRALADTIEKVVSPAGEDLLPNYSALLKALPN